ncbi:MAG: hypothetical protein V1779_07890 [bacterium]
MGLKGKKDTLVALLKDRGDYYYADVEHWYRIPCSTKRIPDSIKDKSIKYISFYLTSKFKELKWSILWFAEVKKIKIVKGKDLIYKNDHPKSEDKYYKIEIGQLEKLPSPIHGRRGRRFLFMETTEERLKIQRN